MPWMSEIWYERYSGGNAHMKWKWRQAEKRNPLNGNGKLSVLLPKLKIWKYFLEIASILLMVTNVSLKAVCATEKGVFEPATRHTLPVPCFFNKNIGVCVFFWTLHFVSAPQKQSAVVFSLILIIWGLAGNFSSRLRFLSSSCSVRMW